MLYMFRTPFASIIRSTINCNWNKSWIDVQGRCTLYYSMANMWHFDHWIVQCATDLEHLYRIYSIPTHDKHQWLLLQFIVLLMMGAKGVRNILSILVIVNKHNTARVASCWFIIYYTLVMHGNSNIKYSISVYSIRILYSVLIHVKWIMFIQLYEFCCFNVWSFCSLV